MSKVRVLVGTRKGAFILNSDGARKSWDVQGPLFPGWEIYHLKGSPVDPDRLYASQSSGWFGQVMQRSSDAGKTWETVGNQFLYEGEVGPHKWYDGSPHPYEFKRVWHLEPSLHDADSVYAGAEDAALFREGLGVCQVFGSWSAFANQDDPHADLDQPNAGDEYWLSCYGRLAEIVAVVRRVVEEAGRPDVRLYQRMPQGAGPPYRRIVL